MFRSKNLSYGLSQAGYYNGKSRRFWSQTDFTLKHGTITHSLAYFAISLSLSEPQFPHLWRKDKNTQREHLMPESMC